MTESASLTPPSSMPRLSSSLPGTGPGTPPTMNGISGAPTSAPSADTTDSDELDAANFDDPPDLFQLENGTRGF